MKCIDQPPDVFGDDSSFVAVQTRTCNSSNGPVFLPCFLLLRWTMTTSPEDGEPPLPTRHGRSAFPSMSTTLASLLTEYLSLGH